MNEKVTRATALANALALPTILNRSAYRDDLTGMIIPVGKSL